MTKPLRTASTLTLYTLEVRDDEVEMLGERTEQPSLLLLSSRRSSKQQPSSPLCPCRLHLLLHLLHRAGAAAAAADVCVFCVMSVCVCV